MRVVAHGVKQGVEEDGTARGDEGAFGASLQFDLLVPGDGGIGEQSLEHLGGLGVHGEEIGGGRFGDAGVVGDGLVGETLGIAKLDGDDVLDEIRDGGAAANIAGKEEGIGMLLKVVEPVGRIGIDPLEDVGSGKGRHTVHC